MLDDLSQTSLQMLYRRESRTFLRYVRESSPWVAAADGSLLRKIEELAGIEADELAEFARFLDSNHVALPYLGTYPIRFAAYNFTNVRKLIPLVIDDHRRHLVALETERNALAELARPSVDRLIEMRRNHLQQLEQLQGVP
jgi:hypothetical protein